MEATDAAILVALGAVPLVPDFPDFFAEAVDRANALHEILGNGSDLLLPHDLAPDLDRQNNRNAICVFFQSGQILLPTVNKRDRQIITFSLADIALINRQHAKIEVGNLGKKLWLFGENLDAHTLTI
jgi:hypothetical protein